MNTEQQKKSDERFNKMITMLIATVAIWVAITVYFQNYASNISAQARRRAQENAIAATKKELNGTIQFSYQWQGALQTWREIGWQIIAAEQEGDTAAVERYTKLQERIAALSDLLSPNYFDPAVGQPDTGKYESETYLVESTRLNEIYVAESELGRATDETADSLVAQITLLTVSLSLYGLSTTLKGGVRWLFVIIGSGIVGLCMVWLSWSMIELLARPEVNHTAINAYSEGVGLYYQQKYDEAIAKFSFAIAEKSDYGKAYYERGFANFDKNNIAAAIQDFEAAREAGLDDINTNGNLGWAYYLNGQFPQAIEADQRVIALDPRVLGVRMNEALTYLAMGDIPRSQQQYDLFIQETERQVDEAHQNNTEPSASLWFYMEAGATDLQNLIDQLSNKPKLPTEAPATAMIQGDHDAIRNFAYQQMIRIKEANTALEYTGQLPVSQEVMQVQPFAFGQITERNEEGLVTSFESSPNASFPNQTKSVTVEYSYSGPPPKQMIWKLYFNGVEDQSLRVISNHDIGSGSLWYQTFGYNYTSVFVFTPGEFVVELYADSKLAQSGTFFIEP
jgi:tetratricopeptide (TPR) repeat protein